MFKFNDQTFLSFRIFRNLARKLIRRTGSGSTIEKFARHKKTPR